jgi:hypothetical protein
MGVRKSIFRNKQWEVTSCGLASLRTGAPCCFLIEAESLLATGRYGGRELYDWPMYVVQKRWVDRSLFIEAFKAALAAHEGRYTGTVDRELLADSCEEARRAGKVGPIGFNVRVRTSTKPRSVRPLRRSVERPSRQRERR